jgi:peptide/nickel transport system substrate-binding protein
MKISPRATGRNPLAKILVALVGLVLVAGCTSGNDEDSGDAGGSLGTVNLRLEGDWPHLDPTGRTPGGGLQTQVLTAMLYDSLVVIGPDPENDDKPGLLPYLAESWKSSPSELSFKIKDGATCSDGTPVNASLVKRNVDTRLEVGTGIASQFGAGPFTTTADDTTNTFTMKLGTPYYDALYAFVELRIVCSAGLDDPESIVNAASGSGPYTLESAQHGAQAVLKRREDWTWGPNGITSKDIPSEVVAKVVTNETTAANLLLTGGLDVTRVGGADLARVQSDPSVLNEKTTSFYNNSLIFSQDGNGPTSDPVVREALYSAIDLDGWNQAANQGNGTVSPSFLQPKADCYDPGTEDFATEDPGPDKARQILLDAGWTEDSDGKLEKDGEPLTIVLVSTTITGLGNGGEYLASQWDEAGITVDSRITGDYNIFLQRGINGDFDVMTTNYPFDQPNPNRAVGTFTGDPAVSWTKGATTEIDAEIAQAEATTGDERCQHWSNVQEMLLEDHSILPLASPEVYWFTKGIDLYPAASTANPIFFRRAE